MTQSKLQAYHENWVDKQQSGKEGVCFASTRTIAEMETEALCTVLESELGKPQQ